MSAKKELKILLARECLTLTKLAEVLSEYTGKEFTRSALAQKLARGTFRFDDFETICEILGYELKCEKKH